MSCNSSPYINLSNLEADGCCTGLMANELQHLSAQYYDYMQPFVMTLAGKASVADTFGQRSRQDMNLNSLLDIHMLYGYLLAVYYERLNDINNDPVCHRDKGNLYYYDTYQFACIIKHFQCLNIDIIPALEVFNIDQTPLQVDGIGWMYIVRPAKDDCGESSLVCSALTGITFFNSVTLDSILLDGAPIAFTPYTGSNFTVMYNQIAADLLLLGYVVTVLSTAPSGEQVWSVCIPHSPAHALTIEVNYSKNYETLQNNGNWDFITNFISEANDLLFPAPYPNSGNAAYATTFKLWDRNNPYPGPPLIDLFNNTMTYYSNFSGFAIDTLFSVSNAWLQANYTVSPIYIPIGPGLMHWGIFDNNNIIYRMQIHRYVSIGQQTSTCVLTINPISGGNDNDIPYENPLCLTDDTPFQVY